jgi:hypothetical protein
MTTEQIKQTLLSVRPDRPRSTENRRLQCAVDEAIKIIDTYDELVKHSEIKIENKQYPELFKGCLTCDAHSHCADAFQSHSVYCNAYGKTCGY